MTIRDFEQASPYIAFLVLVVGSLAAYLLKIMPGEMFSAVLGGVVSYVTTKDRGANTGTEMASTTVITEKTNE